MRRLTLRGHPSSSTGKTRVAGNLAHAGQGVHSLFSTRKSLILVPDKVHLKPPTAAPQDEQYILSCLLQAAKLSEGEVPSV